MKQGKKTELILAIVLVVVVICCVVVYLGGKGKQNEVQNSVPAAIETTTVQETTTLQGIEIEESMGSDDGFSELIPVG